MKRTINYVATIFLLLTQATSLLAVPGELDTSFSGDGKLKIEVGAGESESFSAALQSDGKIVAAGRVNRGSTAVFGLARYNANGTLDSSFGLGGLAVADHDFGTVDSAFGVAIQSDGRIVAAGTTATQSPSEHRFAVARFNADGSLDSSFDGDGKVTTDFPGNVDVARAVEIQSDGKIVVGGRAFPGNADFAVARYNTDGSLDSGFSGDGMQTTDLFFNGDDAEDLVIQADGKIVLVGSTNTGGATQIGIARYNSNGLLDTTFDTDGVMFAGHGGSGIGAFASGTAIDVQADGKLVIAALGGNTPQFTIVRLTSTGAVDGTTRTTILASNIARAIKVQADGKIVLTGSTSDFSGGAEDFGAVRFNADLSLDTSFSFDGKVRTDFNNTSGDIPYGLVVQADGRLVLTGSSFGVVRDFALLRYSATGVADPTFDGDGKRVDGFGKGISRFSSVVTQSDTKIVAVGSQVGTNSADMAIYRFNADGTPDTTFSADGVVATDTQIGQDSATAAVLQTDGKILVSGATDHPKLNILAARYNADGSPDTTFNSTGLVVTGVSGSVSGGANAIAVEATGKILLAGWRNTSALSSEITLFRLSATGGLEAIVTTNLPGFNERARSMVVQSDGKILVAANGIEDTNQDFVVLRYNSDLSLDPSFSGDGIAFIDFGPGDDFANSLALQADGRIIVGGQASNGANNDFGIVRLDVDGVPDPTFGTDGRVMSSLGTGSDQANSVRIQFDGKIVAGGFATTGTNSDFAIVRYNTNGSLDSAPLWGTGGVSTADLGSADAINGIAIQADGRVIAVGESGGNIAAARFLGDPLPPSSANVSVGGRVATADGAGVRNAVLTLTSMDGTVFAARTSAFGYYRFDEVPSGETYVLTIQSKRYTFSPPTRMLTVNDSITDADFTALE